MIEVPRRRPAHPVVVLVGFFAITIGTVLLAYFGHIPWLRSHVPVYLVILHPAFLKLVVLPTGVVFAIIAARHFQARAGHVEFFEDRIELSKHEGAAVVHWSELAGYRDDSSDFIQLLRKGERLPSSQLTVPTATEEARVAVLRLLDERGIRRAE